MPEYEMFCLITAAEGTPLARTQKTCAVGAELLDLYRGRLLRMGSHLRVKVAIDPTSAPHDALKPGKRRRGTGRRDHQWHGAHLGVQSMVPLAPRAFSRCLLRGPGLLCGEPRSHKHDKGVFHRFQHARIAATGES